MRLSTHLLFPPLFVLALWVQVVLASGSEDTSSDWMEDEEGSPRSVGNAPVEDEGVFVPATADTAAQLRDGQLLPTTHSAVFPHAVPRVDSPPPQPVLSPHPALPGLRANPEASRLRRMGQSTSEAPDEITPPGAPEPHPGLARMRARERENAEWKAWRARMAESGQASGSQPVLLGEPLTPSRSSPRGAAPATLEAFQHATPAEAGQTASPRTLSHMFASYRSELPITFDVGGLPYGHIPAIPLPQPQQQLSEPRARVIFPTQFHSLPQRTRAHRMASDPDTPRLMRTVHAREAHRLYKDEAEIIRDVMQRSMMLPLYTSDEFRHWITVHGPSIMRNQAYT